MQRVRIGLTGLAFVFVVVLLAMALVGEPLGEEPITANLLEMQSKGEKAPDPAQALEPAEPLAELGVAPGKAEANNMAAKASEDPAGN